MLGRNTRSLVVAVVAALLVPPLCALALVGAIEYRDASDEAASRIDLRALLGPANDVSAALAGETAWQATRIVGLDEVLRDVPGPETVQRTDMAIATARAAAGPDEAEPLAAATDVLQGLADVRAEADAIAAAGPADLGQLTPATSVTDSYEQLADAYDTELWQVVLTYDDPDLRQAAELTLTAHRLGAQSAMLRRDLLLAGVDPAGSVNDPDEITELAVATSSVARTAADLRAAPAPYDTLVAAADLDAVDALVAQAEEILSSGEPVPVAELVSTGGDEPLAALGHEIATAYDEQVATDDGGGGRAGALALAFAGTLGALIAVGVITAQLLRLRNGPRDGSPSDLPPTPPPPPGSVGQPPPAVPPPSVPSPPGGGA